MRECERVCVCEREIYRVSAGRGREGGGGERERKETPAIGTEHMIAMLPSLLL